MPVTRSALASSAARSRQSPRSAPTQRRDRRRPAASAGAPASPCVPSLAWKVIVSSAGTRLSSVRLRSRSQKCRASDEARAQHALVAGDDRRAAILRRDIGHEGEIRRRPPGRVAQREIALVDAHRDLQHLRRQIHEGGRRCGRAAAPAIPPARPPRRAARHPRTTREIRAPPPAPRMPSAISVAPFGRVGDHVMRPQLLHPIGRRARPRRRRAPGSGGPR